MNPSSTSIVAAAVAPVPMSRPDITSLEITSVTEVLHSGCLSIGPRLDAFEAQVARLTGTRHAIGVSSGTAGLHLAAIASGIGAGDLVVTTPFSFIASANCLLYERAIPVFVDVDPITGNIDPALAAEAVRGLSDHGAARDRWLPRRGVANAGTLKAILPVHAFGQPADMDAIGEVATTHDLRVIEDACEALGAEYNGRPAGALGDIGVFAFYPNKQATTGEGGMIVTNRDDYAALFRSLRNQGRDAMTAWLAHDRLGFNYRMSELNAALGVCQLTRLDELLARRNRVTRWYEERLAGMAAVAPPTAVPSTTKLCWFAYVVRLDPGIDRGAVMTDLEARGIPSRPYFTPIHLQPFYAARFGYRPGDFPVTESLGQTCLALPFAGTMTEGQVDRVCVELAAAVGRQRVAWSCATSI